MGRGKGLWVAAGKVCAASQHALPGSLLASAQQATHLHQRKVLPVHADYPFKAPAVRFDTPCFHPNVDQHGNICLDILKEKWSAAYSVRTVLLSIQSLLGEPNNDSPLNAYAAKVRSHGSQGTCDDCLGFFRVLRPMGQLVTRARLACCCVSHAVVLQLTATPGP